MGSERRTYVIFMLCACVAVQAAVVTDSFLHQGHEQDVLVLYTDVPVSTRMDQLIDDDNTQHVAITLLNTEPVHVRNQKINALERLNSKKTTDYAMHYEKKKTESILTFSFAHQAVRIFTEQLKNFHDLATTIITIKRAVPRAHHRTGKPLIVIDCGHGGDQPGAHGLFGLVEKDIVLQLGKKIYTDLRKRGYHVLMTRNVDVSVDIDERTSLANKKDALVLISLHNNYAQNAQVRGIETLYYWPRDKTLAQRFHKNVMKMPITGLVDRGVRQALVQMVYGCECPAVLLELFFLSNEADVRLLQQEKVRAHIVRSVSEAIDDVVKWMMRTSRGFK